MAYKKEDIEFGFLLLNDRDSLTDEEVAEWMKSPSNLRLLNDMEGVRRDLEALGEESEPEKIERLMREQRSRKMTLRWSLVIAFILIIIFILQQSIYR